MAFLHYIQNKFALMRWILIGVISIIFLVMAYLQIMGKMSLRFHDWGYPAWSPFMIGVTEILAVLGLYFQRFFGWATAVLSIIATGALLTAVGHHEKWIRPISEGWITPITALVTLIFIVLMMYLNARVKSMALDKEHGM